MKQENKNIGVLMTNLERMAKLQVEILKNITENGSNRPQLSEELAKTMVWIHATLGALGWEGEELETLTNIAYAKLEDEVSE